MRKPRRWWVLGALFVSAAGVVAARTGAGGGGAYPLHFWVRDGEDPPRTFETPGGREIGAWDVTRRSEPLRLHCRTRLSLVSRVLDAAGLPREPTFGVVTGPIVSAVPVAGWHEYLVDGFGPIVESAVIDPGLVGSWRSDNHRGWTLHADGSIVGGPRSSPDAQWRWGRLGDVLVFTCRYPGDEGWSCLTGFVLDADRLAVRDDEGRVFRKQR